MTRTLKVSDNGSGHNSGGALDGEALKRYVDRVANIMQEQKDLAEAIKEICAECDEAGVASKKEVRRRARESLMDPEVLRSQLDRDEEQRRALGWLADTPLGEAAIKEAGKPRRQRNADAEAGKRQGRIHSIEEALEAGRKHLSGDEGLSAGAVPSPFEDDRPEG